MSNALRGLRARGSGYDAGRVAVDLAVMLADGGQAISDLALLPDQPDAFGPGRLAAWRVLAGIGPAASAALHSARADAREVARLQTPGPPATYLRLTRAVTSRRAQSWTWTPVACHSEKEQATATYKRGFGHHPLLCFLDNTGEALAGVLRPGNAGVDTTSDRITLLDQPVARVPGTPPRHQDHRPTRTPAPRRTVVTVRPRRRHTPPGIPHRQPIGEGSLHFLEARSEASARGRCSMQR